MQYVCFKGAGGEYAVGIGQIQEIIYFKTPTPIPDAPPFVEGMIDLRGKMVPIINLHKRIHGSEDPGARRHILILKMAQGARGLTVDEVTGVVEIGDAAMEKTDSRIARGIFRNSGKMILFLDIERLL